MIALSFSIANDSAKSPILHYYIYDDNMYDNYYIYENITELHIYDTHTHTHTHEYMKISLQFEERSDSCIY